MQHSYMSSTNVFQLCAHSVVAVVVVDPHIQRIVLAAEETPVTQRVSRRPIKCQSGAWSQRGTKINGSHHVTTRYSNQQGSKSRQNPCQVQPTKDVGKLSASRRCVFGCEVQFLLSGVLPGFQNLDCKLQSRLPDVLSIR